MVIKLQFKRKDNGMVEKFELHPQDVTKLNVSYIATMDRDDKMYAWPFGSCNIFESKGNVLCAEFIEIEYLYIEYIKDVG